MSGTTPATGPRICFDFTIGARAKHSGMWRYLKNVILGVLEAAPETRYEFLVMGGTPDDFRRDALDFVPERCPIHHLPLQYEGNRRLEWMHRDWVSLPRFLDQSGFDLFHGQYQTLPRCRKTRVVTTLHDLISFREHEWLPVQPYQRLYRSYCLQGYRRADAIISISESTKQDLHSRVSYPDSRSYAIHSGVDPLFFEPVSEEGRSELAERHGIKPPYLLYVGDLSPRKNAVTLVRAYAEVKKAIPEAPPLILCGKSWFIKLPELEEAGALGVGDHVRHVSGLSEAALLALYKQATVFAFASLWEGFGFPPLEAMAAGVPVVASNLSSIPELVGDTGILCDPKSPQQFAAGLVRLLQNPEERQRRAEAGLARARTFTWKRTGEGVARVYRECAR